MTKDEKLADVHNVFFSSVKPVVLGVPSPQSYRQRGSTKTHNP